MTEIEDIVKQFLKSIYIYMKPGINRKDVVLPE
jgi:hypothetical protein